MDRVKWILVSLAVSLISGLLFYLYALKHKVEKLNLQLENQKIITITKDREIFKLQDILKNQNQKIKDLSEKQQKAIEDYKTWVAKEDKFQQEINALLSTQGKDTCDTIIKRLELIKIKGYNGL